MSPGPLPRDDDAWPEGVVPDADRSRAGCLWPPRPSTLVAVLIVGASLVGVDLVDADFARNLSEMYGWPFAYGLAPAGVRGHSNLIYAAALAADLVISFALLASTYAVTQMAACLQVPSQRLNVRHLGIAVVLAAVFLAGCR